MKPTTLLVSFAVLALAWKGTEGLKCYVCTYATADGTLIPGADASCADGSTPKKEFLMECKAETAMRPVTISNGAIVYNKTVFSDFSTSELSPNQNFIWGCATVSGKGQSSAVQGELNIMDRGCFGFLQEETQQCQAKTFHEWSTATDLMSQLVTLVTTGYGFDHGTNLKSCYCKTEGYLGGECPSGSSASENSMSVSLVLGLAVLTFLRI